MPDGSLWSGDFFASAVGMGLLAFLRKRLVRAGGNFPNVPPGTYAHTITRGTVVIPGQDPYHGRGQAEGFFSVTPGTPDTTVSAQYLQGVAAA
jgi:uracil-DNA glycosylase